MKKRILFVDDDETILTCYRFTVESEDNIVYTAKDYTTALEIVSQNKIDVAVLDYKMPEIKGDELAKRINTIDPSVKIYFISGYDIALEAVKQLNLSIYGVFRKPVNPDLLINITDIDGDGLTSYQTARYLHGNLYTNFCAVNTL